MRPAFFLFAPPHCLKKKGTLALRHWFRRSTTQVGSIGRAPGPDSPPTMAQLICWRSKRSRGAEQGLQRQELHASTRASEVIDPPDVLRRLDADAHPDVWCPRQLGVEFSEPIGALGQDLKSMPVGPSHDVEDALDERERNVFVEEVAHRVYENRLRLSPVERQLQHLRLERQLETVAVVRGRGQSGGLL